MYEIRAIVLLPRGRFILMTDRKIERIVRMTNLHDEQSDFAYWQTKSYAERVAALEEIRREYNNWRYTDAERRFQRVWRIASLKDKNSDYDP